MAKAVLNSGLEQIRGTLSDWVYKVVRGKRIIAKRPIQDPNRLPKPAEIETRKRFADAAAFGRTVIGDDTLRVFYNQIAKIKDKPVFAVAVGDFFTPPVIHDIGLDSYTGQPGSKIVVRASDDVQVMSVTVTIRDTTTKAVLESGAAILVGGDWVYTATTARAQGQSVTIEATAKDRPGNEGAQIKVAP